LAATNSHAGRNLVTLISVMVLVGTEVLAVALAAGWAIAGLFELGEIVRIVLMVLFSLLGLYALHTLWKSATAVEPIR